MPNLPTYGLRRAARKIDEATRALRKNYSYQKSAKASAVKATKAAKAAKTARAAGLVGSAAVLGTAIAGATAIIKAGKGVNKAYGNYDKALQEKVKADLILAKHRRNKKK